MKYVHPNLVGIVFALSFLLGFSVGVKTVEANLKAYDIVRPK